MADESLGSLSVQITGDYSALSDAIDQAQQVATAGAQQIESAITQAGDSAASDLSTLATAVGEVGTATETTDSTLAEYGDSLQTVSDATTTTAQSSSEAADSLNAMGISVDEVTGAVTDAAAGTTDLAEASTEAGAGAEEAESGLAAMAEQLTLVGEALAITEGLKEFGEEALEAYSTAQNLATSLGILSGNAAGAQEVVEGLVTTSNEYGVSLEAMEGATQRLGPILLQSGVSLDELSETMNAAAAASAVTGKSVEQLGTSMQMMVLSGMASTRQLSTLGVSFNQFAVQLGLSADAAQAQVTAAFKAMDPSERIEAILPLLNNFSTAAVQMGQNVGGSWQKLENDTVQAFEAIGQAIAPEVQAIVTWLHDELAPEIQSLSVSFERLPAPVKDVAVGFGLVVAALVPLTGALAAIGLAFAGLQGLLPAVTGLLGALGLTAGETAAAETAEATAATAEAGAHAELTTAVEGSEAALGSSGFLGTLGGVTGALSALAPLVLSFGAAWLATKNNIDTLDQSYKTLDNDMIVNAVASGKSVASLEALGLSANQIKAALSGASQALEQNNQQWPTFKELIDAGTTSTDAFSKGLQALVTTQLDANQAVADAKTVLDEAKTALDNGSISQDTYNRALTAYETALNNANTAQNAAKDSYSALVGAFGNAQATFTLAEATFQKISDQFAQGQVSAGLFADAYAKVVSAAKAAGTTFSDVDGDVQKLIVSSQNQTKALTDALAAYEAIKNADVPGTQLAIGDALAQVDTKAKAVGISVTQVGDALQFSVAPNSKLATDAVQSLVNQLQGMYGAVDQAGVIINGTFVPSLKAVSGGLSDVTDYTVTGASTIHDFASQMQDSGGAAEQMAGQFLDASNAVVTLKGNTDNAAQSFDSADTVLKGFGDDVSSVSDLLKQMATDTETAASAFDDLASAANNAASAVTKAGAAGGKSGGGGGSSGEMSTDKYIEDLLSVYANPIAGVGGNEGFANAIGGISGEMPSTGTLEGTLGALGEVQTAEGVYETVDQYNAAIQALATQLGDTTYTYTDQFGNILDGLSKTASTSTTATAANTIATTANTTATTTATAALTGLAGATEGNVDSSTALSEANAALGANFSDVNDAMTAVQAAIQQMDEDGFSVATGALQQIEADLWGAGASVVSMTAYSGTAATALGTTASAATTTTAALTTAGTGALNLASATTTAATSITSAVSNAMVAVQAATVQIGAYVAGANAQVTTVPTSVSLGAGLTGSTQLVGVIVPGTGQVYDPSQFSQTFEQAQPLPTPPAINITVQAGTIVGQNGAQQLAQIVQNQVTQTLKQAGLKL